MNLDDLSAYIFVCIATTSFVATVMYPIFYWQAVKDWRVWPYVMMSFCFFFASAFIVISSSKFPYLERSSVRLYILIGWAGVYLFYTVATLGSVYAIIQSQRVKWAERLKNSKNLKNLLHINGEDNER